MARFSQNSSSNNSSSALNYVQVAGTQQTISSAPSSIIDLNITTTGKPVQISVTGEGANASAGSWLRLNLFRDGVEIGNAIQLESSAASENVPFAINFIDAVAAGTYNYSARVTSINGGNWTFGEAAGPVMNAVELTGFEGDRGPRGFTGDDALWNFRGVYDLGASYAIGDVATYDGETWYRLDANGGNTGDTPTEGDFWTLIAQKGDSSGTADIADFVFTTSFQEGNTPGDDTSYMTVHNHDMEIRTTRDNAPEGPYDADISINSADDVWITANDTVEVSSVGDEVVIYTNDFNTRWAFNPDGGIHFPDDTVQTTAYTGGDTASHGDFIFDAATLRVDSSSDMILEANEGDGTVAAQIKVGAGDIPLEVASYRQTSSLFGTSDWSTAEWQSDGNGAGQIVITGSTNVVDFLNTSFNGSFQKITVNNEFMSVYNGGSYGGDAATLYVSTGPEGGTPVTLTTLTFTWSDKSGITIDYDDDEMNIIASNMQLNIETTGNEDIYIISSDDMRLEARDDFFIRSDGYINFVASSNENNYEWRMESNGTLEFPARGRLRNPASSSGDGNGYDTFHIIPDFSRYEYDQYLVVDPTAPNHIHIRPGGTPDASQADLIIGAERTHVRVSDNYNYGGSVNVTSKVSPLTGNYLNTAPEAGSDMLVETTDLGFITEGTYVYVDNTKYYVTNLQTDTPIAGSSIITAAGANFVPNGYYTFITDQGENYWAFTSEGFLTGPAMGYVNVYGISNPATDTYLGINSSHKVTISGTDGEFLGDPEVANNQIATIGDVETAQGAGANGEITRWSPNFQATGLSFTGSGTTYPTYNSHYVKNGRMVSFWIEIDLATVTNFGTGQYITALPYAPLAGTMNHFQAWANVDPAQNPDIAGHVVLQADHLANTTALDLHYLKQAGGANSPLMEAMFTQGAPATLTTSSKIYINGTYITAE